MFSTDDYVSIIYIIILNKDIMKTLSNHIQESFTTLKEEKQTVTEHQIHNTEGK